MIYHVNPNCRDPRFCKTHGETGPVEYDTEKMLKFIKHSEDRAMKVREIALAIQRDIGTLKAETDKLPNTRFIQAIVFVGLFIILLAIYIWTH